MKQHSYTIPEAIRLLFEVDTSKHPGLRNSINTLIRAISGEYQKPGNKSKQSGKGEMPMKLERGSPEEGEHYDRLGLQADQLTILHNAVILHGLFSTPKQVCLLLQKPEERTQHVGWLRELLIHRQSVAGLGLIRPELLRLLAQLEDPHLDLQTTRLANPFEVLPQMGLGDYGGNLLKALAMQTAVLSTSDSMMVHYFDQDLEKAHAMAMQLQTTDPMLSRYRDLILREYQDAVEFDALLDLMR